MAASAALTIPLQISPGRRREDALAILENSAGSRGRRLDAAGQRHAETPVSGQYRSLMGKLRRKKLIAGLPSIGVSRAGQGRSSRRSAPDVLERLPRFRHALERRLRRLDHHRHGDLATTSALRYIFEEIVNAGLMPVDFPTVAGSLEFVL